MYVMSGDLGSGTVVWAIAGFGFFLICEIRTVLDGVYRLPFRGYVVPPFPSVYIHVYIHDFIYLSLIVDR